jgi:hypothetical protein
MFEIFAIWSEIRRAMPQLCTTIASQATGSQAAHPAQPQVYPGVGGSGIFVVNSPGSRNGEGDRD